MPSGNMSISVCNLFLYLAHMDEKYKKDDKN